MPWYSVREQIKSVVVDDGVMTIGRFAFSGCSALASVTIGTSVRDIGQGAFYGCSSLASVTIPEGVTTIGSSAFSGCSALASVTIPASVTTIGSGAFQSCTSLTNIFFLGTSWVVTSIGSYAFSLGTSSVPVTATIHSPNNVANGQLDAYTGSYTTLNYVASVLHTYTINVNDATYGSVSPTSVQIYDGTSLVQDGNRLVFTDGQIVTATPA